MNRAPLCATADRHGEARRRARQAYDRASQLRWQSEQARSRASSIRATTIAILGRERERMHQYWIDTEVAATERLIEHLVVPGRERYPDLAVLDPYLAAAAKDPLYLLDRLVEAALRESSADHVVVQLAEPGVGADIRVDGVTEFGPYDGPGGRWSGIDAAEVNAGGGETDGGVSRSVPLVTMTGRVLGVLSCHYDRLDARIEEERQLFDLVALAAAKATQWHGVWRRHRVERSAVHEARPLRAVH